jgi:omega-hydroxy-beta-dihydromenaquinone-9 sulfotransferase
MHAPRPIFVVGTGRCGSTMFHDVLCSHPSLGWLSQLVHKYPRRPELNAKLVGIAQRRPFVAPLRRVLYPAEPYRFWETYCPGFSTPYRDLLDTDLTPLSAKKLNAAVDRSTAPGKRFLAKITGWPRIGLIRAAFPDAQFIHVIRDGRAVVNSVVAAPYFDGWSGPSNWTRGTLNKVQEDKWADSGHSFIVLAAIGWENRIRAFQSARQSLLDRQYLEIHYENFCDDPHAVLANVIEFLNLPPGVTSEFFTRIRSKAFSSQNDKWRQDLTAQQQHDLHQYLAPLLSELGYT